ncbi:hypothetical protein AgCh_029607 [Apium graveolens]
MLHNNGSGFMEMLKIQRDKKNGSCITVMCLGDAFTEILQLQGINSSNYIEYRAIGFITLRPCYGYGQVVYDIPVDAMIYVKDPGPLKQCRR